LLVTKKTIPNPYEEIAEFASPTVMVCSQFPGKLGKNYQNQKIVIYSCLAEVLSVPLVIEVLEYFKNSFTILLVHRDYPTTELEQKYNCKFIKVKYAYAYYSKFLMHSDLYDYSVDLSKKFLSFNQRADWSRQALMQFLVKFNLLDDFYFSYWCHAKSDHDMKSIYNIVNKTIGDTWFNKDLDLEKLYQMLPIKIPMDQFDGTNEGLFAKTLIYQKTFASFVNETYTSENFNVHFTEKLMKPLANGHPFLLFSSAGALDALRKLGFQTFEDVIDESYDLIQSPQLRFEQLLRESQRLCNFDLTELKKIKHHLWPRIKHNYEWFWNQMPKLYDEEITGAKMQIQDIIDNL